VKAVVYSMMPLFLARASVTVADVTVQRMDYQGLQGVQLENEELRVVILPDLGAKMISLIYKPTSREWLWHNPIVPLRLAEYGASFVDYDLSGFDECFPTIGPRPYPDGLLKGVRMPDHGEVWAISWLWSPLEDGVQLSAEGVNFPYRFVKTVRLADPATVSITYAVEVYDRMTIKAIWAAHPLFAIRSAGRILLPEGTTLRVGGSQRLGEPGTEHPWPQTQDVQGNAVDLSRLNPPRVKWADKLFTKDLPERWAALHDPTTGEFVGLHFPESPALGLWINQGGFPADGPHYNVALEPTNAGAEEVNMAEQWGLPCSWTGTTVWHLNLVLGAAANAEEIRARVWEGGEEGRG